MMKFYLRIERTGELIPMEWNPQRGVWSSPKDTINRNEVVSLVIVRSSDSQEVVATHVMSKGDVLVVPWESIQYE